MDIPIMLQTGKMLKTCEELFGDYECGLSEDEVPALTIYRKRAVNVETERKPKIRTTEITADEFYVAVLSNEAKVVLAKFKA